MSKLDLAQQVPNEYDPQVISRIIRAICGQLNTLSEGQITAKYNAQASVPTGTAISYQTGDFIPDSNCTVRGSVAPGLAASYVRIGWKCTAPGAGGTAVFQEVRVLNGS